MESIRFQVKCDAATILGFAAREKNGARYETFFYCPANKWQNIAIDLDALKPAADAKDDNGHLDLNDLTGVYLADAAGMFVDAFPGQEGGRILWLDDVEYSSQRVVPQNLQFSATAANQPLVVDSFEGGTIQWIPLLLQTQPAFSINLTNADLSLDKQSAPDGGARSLKATYKRERGNAQVWLHPLENVNLRSAQVLELALRTTQDGVFLITVKEKDDSRYQQIVELKIGDGWKPLSWPLASLTLADDAKDENGRLDAAQIEEISIADITGAMPAEADKGPLGTTSLWIDKVQFGTVAQASE
jgi:hypothetical protein